MEKARLSPNPPPLSLLSFAFPFSSLSLALSLSRARTLSFLIVNKLLSLAHALPRALSRYAQQAVREQLVVLTDRHSFIFFRNAHFTYLSHSPSLSFSLSLSPSPDLQSLCNELLSYVSLSLARSHARLLALS